MSTVQPSWRSSWPITATSRMSGTLWITERPGASRAAAISFRAEFLAPPTYTVPASGRVSGPSETTRKLPMRVTLVTRATRHVV